MGCQVEFTYGLEAAIFMSSTYATVNIYMYRNHTLYDVIMSARACSVQCPSTQAHSLVQTRAQRDQWPSSLAISTQQRSETQRRNRGEFIRNPRNPIHVDKYMGQGTVMNSQVVGPKVCQLPAQLPCPPNEWIVIRVIPGITARIRKYTEGIGPRN